MIKIEGGGGVGNKEPLIFISRVFKAINREGCWLCNIVEDFLCNLKTLDSNPER